MENTERLTFVFEKSEEDLNELWENCFNNPEKLAHINAYSPSALNKRSYLNFLKENGRNKSWIVKRIKENDVIGFVIYGDFFPGFKNDIGFNIGLPYLSNGYATEALNEIVRHLRDSGQNQIFGHCYESNVHSIKTMKKCGFEKTGFIDPSYNGNRVLEFKHPE